VKRRAISPDAERAAGEHLDDGAAVGSARAAKLSISQDIVELI
jgi:hypothetical protein